MFAPSILYSHPNLICAADVGAAEWHTAKHSDRDRHRGSDRVRGGERGRQRQNADDEDDDTSEESEKEEEFDIITGGAYLLHT